MTVDRVLTPGGYRPTHVIKRVFEDEAIEIRNGIWRIHHGSNRIERSGSFTAKGGTGVQAAIEGPVASPTYGSGWIVDAFWINNSGSPISILKAKWTVPRPPSADDGQTIFLFPGVQSADMILQAVLQWGPSSAGGGSHWSVASWYVDGRGGVAFHSELVEVKAEDELTAIITQVQPAGGIFECACCFDGIPGTGLSQIRTSRELNLSSIALEVYNMQTCADYPQTPICSFHDIDLQTAARNPNPIWSAETRNNNCGQSAAVISGANPGGQIDLTWIP